MPATYDFFIKVGTAHPPGQPVACPSGYKGAEEAVRSALMQEHFAAAQKD